MKDKTIKDAFKLDCEGNSNCTLDFARFYGASTNDSIFTNRSSDERLSHNKDSIDLGNKVIWTNWRSYDVVAIIECEKVKVR